MSLFATVGCGSDQALDPVAERLASRRAALGLTGAELGFRDAMDRLGTGGWERRLESLALGEGRAEDALDVGLAVEDLLVAAGRPADADPGFEALFAQARDQARDLARAGVGGEAVARRAAASALVATCARCHNRYRR